MRCKSFLYLTIKDAVSIAIKRIAKKGGGCVMGILSQGPVSVPFLPYGSHNKCRIIMES